MRFLRTLNNEWIRASDIDRMEHRKVSDQYVLHGFIGDERYVMKSFKTESELEEYINVMGSAYFYLNKPCN